MIHVDWHDPEKTIIRLDYTPPIASWEEYQEAVAYSYDLARSVAHSVRLLHNPQDTPMPTGNPLEQILIAARKTPANVDAIAMVITNRIARRITKVALLIFNSLTDYEIFATLDEALAYLSEPVTD